MAFCRRGLLWVSKSTLMVQPNRMHFLSKRTLTPLQQRGNGYRLPLDSSFSCLSDDPENGDVVTAFEIGDAANLFFEQGVSPERICFGGGEAEPIACMNVIADAMRDIRSHRHGMPFVVQTNGLVPNEFDTAVDELITLHDEFRNAPGSDGDPKLSVWVHIGASNPPQYDKVMTPEGTKSAFGEVCNFICTLAEAGVKVYGTVSEHPAVNSREVQHLASSLGCSDCFIRSYHPTTLYNILEVSEDSNHEEIRSGFLHKSKQLHPDLNPDSCSHAMSEVTEAFGILGDEQLRKMYDGGVADLVLNESETDLYSNVVVKSV